jgi:hypothetical protein
MIPLKVLALEFTSPASGNFFFLTLRSLDRNHIVLTPAEDLLMLRCD